MGGFQGPICLAGEDDKEKGENPPYLLLPLRAKESNHYGHVTLIHESSKVIKGDRQWLSNIISFFSSFENLTIVAR